MQRYVLDLLRGGVLFQRRCLRNKPDVTYRFCAKSRRAAEVPAVIGGSEAKPSEVVLIQSIIY